MIISIKSIIITTLTSVLVFVIVDSAVESIAATLTGTTFLQLFEQTDTNSFGFRFQAINLALFTLEMFLVMLFYSLMRSRFSSPKKPTFFTMVFFIVLIILFLFQMINLGIYPLNAGIVFMITTIIAFPAAVSIGAAVYEHYLSIRKE